MSARPLRLVAALDAVPAAPIYCVALSGGLDSVVLLHLAVAVLRAGRGVPLRAIHVHHGLSPQADRWVAHVEALCTALSVPLTVERVEVMSAGEGLEAAARRCRYAVFERLLQPNECLLQGHHEDDQVETRLYRFVRGSGLAGMAGIPETRALGAGQLFRPLLTVPRASLQDYAQSHQLTWVDDESNADERFDRNFLRHQVLPVLRERWPDIAQRFGATATVCHEGEQLLEQLAKIDAATALTEEQGLRMDVLDALPAERRRNLVRHWLSWTGAGFPGRARFGRIFSELMTARGDARPIIAWPAGEVTRYRGVLLAGPKWAEFDPHAILPWQPDLPLSVAGGALSAMPVVGRGLRAPLSDPLTVQFRQGGESCRIARRGSKPLKKWLQEFGIAPPLRARIPLIFVGGTLAAVGDLFVCDGFQAGAGESGWQLHWQRPGQFVADDEALLAPDVD